MADAKKLRGLVKGNLSQLSRNLENWKGAMDLATATKSDHDIKRMEEYQVKCESYLDKVIEFTMEINVLEPADDEETDTAADKVLADWQKKYDEKLQLFYQARQKVAIATPVTPVTPEGTGGGGPRAIRPKANDPLKPEQLAHDARPF